MLAYDILDVLRANRQDARNGAYNLNLEDGAPIGNSRAAQDLTVGSRNSPTACPRATAGSPW